MTCKQRYNLWKGRRKLKRLRKRRKRLDWLFDHNGIYIVVFITATVITLPVSNSETYESCVVTVPLCIVILWLWFSGCV